MGIAVNALSLKEREDTLSEVISKTRSQLDELGNHIEEAIGRLDPVLIEDFPVNEKIPQGEKGSPPSRSPVHSLMLEVNDRIGILNNRILHLIKRIDL